MHKEKFRCFGANLAFSKDILKDKGTLSFNKAMYSIPEKNDGDISSRCCKFLQ
jgi:hypothetical protein